MNPIEQIHSDDKLLAIIIRSSLSSQGYHFFSNPTDQLQCGINFYKAGYRVEPHFHNLNTSVATTRTLEIIHIEEGKTKLSIFSEHKTLVKMTELLMGDTVILFQGGHSLEILQPTKILEIKPGPYLGKEKEKTFFSPEIFPLMPEPPETLHQGSNLKTKEDKAPSPITFHSQDN